MGNNERVLALLRFLASSLTGVYSYASLRTSSEQSRRIRDRARNDKEQFARNKRTTLRAVKDSSVARLLRNDREEAVISTGGRNLSFFHFLVPCELNCGWAKGASDTAGMWFRIKRPASKTTEDSSVPRLLRNDTERGQLGMKASE